MPKDIGFCDVCRRNHDQGRGHRYSAKHKECLTRFLSKASKKIRDVQFFLENVQRLRDEDRNSNKFWCYFCEEEVREQESIFICSNAIRHLSSSKHVERVTRFCCDHGVNLQKRQLYFISEKKFTKWEELCRLSSSSLEFCEGGMLPQPSNHIHLEQSCSTWDSFSKFPFNTSFASVSSISVQPLPVLKDGIFQNLTATTGSSSDGIKAQNFSDQRSFSDSNPHDGRMSQSVFQKTYLNCKQYDAATVNEQKTSSCSTLNSAGIFHSSQQDENVHSLTERQGAHTERSLKQLASTSRTLPPSDFPLASLLPSSRSNGNVHSGALPPWVVLDESRNVLSSDATINTRIAPTLSRTRERKLAKARNPKRVGAAWAEQRRAELGREAKGAHQSQEDGATWLPSFGRVWQSGSRRDSRKEFEAEKKLETRSKVASAEIPDYQPYVSKRLQLDVKTE